MSSTYYWQRIKTLSTFALCFNPLAAGAAYLRVFHFLLAQVPPFNMLKHVKDKNKSAIFRPLGYERVYLPLYKVADTPFHIQVDDLSWPPFCQI